MDTTTQRKRILLLGFIVVNNHSIVAILNYWKFSNISEFKNQDKLNDKGVTNILF